MASEAGAKRPHGPTGESSPDAPAKRVRAERPAKAASTWDVTGRYALKCTCKHEPVDASEYTLDMHLEHDESTKSSSLFAYFNFPNLNLTGIMRLCPKSALDAQEDGLLHLADFESACELADGVAPGPKNKEWLMRWRGEERGGEGIRKVGGETRAQGMFVFKHNARSSPTGSSEAGVHIMFAMVHNGKHLLFEGTQTSGQVPAAAADDSASAWERLFDPAWEDRPTTPEPDWDWDPEAARNFKHHNHWENPPTGGVIKARNKPGHKPGSVVNPTAKSPYLEDQPDWAWNTTGTWKVAGPELASRLDWDGDMTVTLYMENNSKRQKTGRQLWGEFDFGTIYGNMRLCPGSLARFGVHDSDYETPFEDVCVLKPGAWPGPEPPGERRWGFMWRGFSEEDEFWVAEDHETTDILFADYGEDRMTFVAHFKFDNETYLLQALKVKSGVQRSRSDPTPNTEWLRYLPKHRCYE
ncbi:hypothetical protein DL770_002147 [Monosporascus sp. CRB-9-2]|nr:hypothetical protein DL770_002147 [Monosporascus sp. CRB-9-2]